MDYNRFHQKNKKVQNRVIADKDYTYKSLILLTRKYFSKTGKVLDIGCGVGTIDFFLANRGFSVTGVDVSERAINLAIATKEKLGLLGITFICMPVEKLPIFGDFNYAVCSEVLEHLENPSFVVNMINKQLLPNGICIFSVPSKNAPLFRLGLLRKFDKKVGHLRRYSEEEMKKLFVDEGFVVVDMLRTEGVLRNFIYTNDNFGFLVRFIKFPFSLVVSFIDDLLVKLFGESNLYMVVRKK